MVTCCFIRADTITLSLVLPYSFVSQRGKKDVFMYLSSPCVLCSPVVIFVCFACSHLTPVMFWCFLLQLIFCCWVALWVFSRIPICAQYLDTFFIFLFWGQQVLASYCDTKIIEKNWQLFQRWHRIWKWRASNLTKHQQENILKRKSKFLWSFVFILAQVPSATVEVAEFATLFLYRHLGQSCHPF